MAKEVLKLEGCMGLWVRTCASPTFMKPLSIALNELQVPALQFGAEGLGLLQLKDPRWRRARAANSTFCRPRWLWSLSPAPSVWNSPNITDPSGHDVKNHLYATALEEAWWHGIWSWVEGAIFCHLIYWLVQLICFVVQEDHYVARCLFQLDCESS